MFDLLHNHDRIRELILSIGPISVPSPSDDVVIPKHGIGYEGTGSKRNELFEERKKLTAVMERMVAFNPNASVIFPGSLVQGQSLPSGALAPLATKRNPLQITISDLVQEHAGALSRTVSDPNYATITGAIQQIVSENLNTEQPAKISYMKQSIASVDEGLLRLGASAHWMTGSVSGSFSASTLAAQSRCLVRFVQSYYTASCETPNDPADFISDDASFDSFKLYAGPSNPPTYVSSVTYGRELWLLFESTYTAQELESALNATFSVGFVKGDVALSQQHKDVLNSSNVQILVIGGPGTPAIRLITESNKEQALTNFLLLGANYSKTSPGVISSYVCRYLRNNEIAKVSAATDYTLMTRVPNPEPGIRIVSGLFQFHTGSDDKDDDNHVGIRFYLDNGTILHQNGDLPPRKPVDGDATWHDGTNNPPDHYFYVPFSQPVDTSDIDHINIDLWKSGDAHWHFGFTFIVVGIDGKQYVVFASGAEATNFGGATNSETWRVPLPASA